MDVDTSPTKETLEGKKLRFRKTVWKDNVCHVFIATRSPEGDLVAVKLRLRSTFSLERDIKTLQDFKHPHVIQYYHLFMYLLDDTELVQGLVMEYMESNLHQEIAERRRALNSWREPVLLSFLRDIVSALSAAQKLEICHRDLKPMNILVSHGVYKLGDFGSSKRGITATSENTCVGSQHYLSPILSDAMDRRQTCVRHNPYKSDVYSLGLILMEMALLRRTEREVRNVGADLLGMNTWSKEFKGIVGVMLEGEQNRRPDFCALQDILTSKEPLSAIATWYEECPHEVPLQDEWYYHRTLIESEEILSGALTPGDSSFASYPSHGIQEAPLSICVKCAVNPSLLDFRICGLHSYCQECTHFLVQVNNIGCQLCPREKSRSEEWSSKVSSFFSGIARRSEP